MSLSNFASGLFKPSFDPEAYATALVRSDVKYVGKVLKYHPQAANWINAGGRSALNIAVGDGLLEISKLLIGAGADIEHMDPERRMQPLNSALHRNAIEIAETLIDKGADVNARDGNGNRTGVGNGQTPLFMAVSEAPVTMLKKLVSKGADIDAVCDDFTPLMLAAMADNMASIKYLLSAGADIGIKKSNGVTADRLAKNIEAKNILEQAKQRYDLAHSAEEQKKRAEEARRMAETKILQERVAIETTIDTLRQGTRSPMRVSPPLRLKHRFAA
jgi:ankyrin repeat protein